MKINYRLFFDNLPMSLRHIKENYNNEILLDISSFKNAPITTFLTKQNELEKLK